MRTFETLLHSGSVWWSQVKSVLFQKRSTHESRENRQLFYVVETESLIMFRLALNSQFFVPVLSEFRN